MRELDWLPITVVVIIIGAILTVILCYYYSRLKAIKLLSLIPSVWTSLGVLGTFFTLFYYFGIRPPDPELLTPAGLPALMGKLAGAFSTSIVGIFFGLVASYAVRIQVSLKEAKEYNAQPEHRKKDPNDLLLEIINQLNANHEESQELRYRQLKKLEQMAYNSEHFIRIHEIVEEFRYAAREALSFFKEELTGFKMAIHGELRELNGQIRSILGEFGEDLKVLLHDLNQNLQMALEEIQKRVVEEGDKLSEQARLEFQKNLEELLKKMTASFDGYLERLNGWTKEHAAQLDEVGKESIGQIRKFGENAEINLKKIADTTEGHTKTLLEVIEEINGIYKESLEDVIRENKEDLKRLFDQVREAQINTTQQMDAVLMSFRTSVKEYQITQKGNEDLANNLQVQSDNLEKQNRNLEDLISALERYDELIRQLSMRGGDLAIIIEHLDQIRSRFNGQQN